MRKLNELEARQFALMLLAGAPASTACSYFLDATAPDEQIAFAAEEWPRQKEVLAAIRELTGGIPWHEMDPAERLKLALEKHYAEMAFFLWTTNYIDADGAAKIKADTCRQALEGKVAGTAGTSDPLRQFYETLTKDVAKRSTPKAS